MTSLFANRRKPKRVGREVEAVAPPDDQDSGPVVRRPGLTNVPKKKSKLRVSFGPGQSGADEDLSEDDVGGLKPSRNANAGRSLASDTLLKRSLGQDDDRPVYSKDYLDQLRNSTPSTPRDLPSYTSEDEGSSKAVDLMSKFGTDENSSGPIPTYAEIQEKKERRARLAKDQDFISLDDEGDGRYMQLSTHKKTKETRLVRDDEDLGEGFDDYVEDPGRVALGKKAKAAQQRKHREEVRGMIDDAEDTADEDDSEAERNLAYESAQTRKAMDGIGSVEEQGDSSFPGPTIITPIPRLSTVLDRLRSKISAMEYTRARCSKRMADLQQEKAEIAVREIEIQRLLRETGEKYEKAQEESKMEGRDQEANGTRAKSDRGLETMGVT